MIRPEPLVAVTPDAPDRDYGALYAAALARTGQLAAPGWSDHNQSDPGITLLQVLCWGLADAHYRVSQRGLDIWPLTTPSADPRLGDPARTAAVAGLLSRRGPDGHPLAWSLAHAVQRADSRHDALRMVVDAVSATGITVTPVVGHACVRLLRRDLLRRAVLDSSAVVASAVEEAAVHLSGAPHAEVGAADVDAAATALLLTDPALVGLWPDEIADLVARNRARLDLERVAARADELRSALDRVGLDTISAALVGDGVDPDRAALAKALCPSPPGLSPEHWEDADGDTAVWPPTPDQALRCEPVTAADYATRTRAVHGVRRAWAVAGALPGLAWHRRATVVTDRRGTVTLLVERDPDERADLTDDDLLLAVIDEVLGEAAAPWSALGHRRVLGDEIGAALVRHHPVEVAAVLHCSPGTDPDEVVVAARGRVRAFLERGRPRSLPGPTDLGRGPWPDAPQPADGWEPGEAIPVTELVQVLADDPLVLGVSEVQAVVRDGPVLREQVRVVATDPVVPTGSRVVDGLTVTSGDRVLLTAQPDASANGVYVAGPGPWERSPDLRTADSQVGAVVTVLEGSWAGMTWEQTTDAPLRLETSPLMWRRIARAVRTPVRVAVTGPVVAEGQRRLDEVRLFAGDRVLLVGQGDPADNGEYEVQAGPWTRTAPPPPHGGVLTVGGGSLAGTSWRYDAAAGWVRTGAPQPPDRQPTGYVPVPAGGVPVLADADCLVARLVAQEVEDA
jgi:hypothetical protein